MSKNLDLNVEDVLGDVEDKMFKKLNIRYLFLEKLYQHNKNHWR